jgi:hypothetical protein
MASVRRRSDPRKDVQADVMAAAVSQVRSSAW